MPMWSCDHGGCSMPAVRKLGECILCNRHLCARHLTKDYHECPEWVDEKRYDPTAREAERQEVNRLIEGINTTALANCASALRSGIEATIPSLLEYDRDRRDSVMGGMNYHIEITFSDGVVWLARIRRFKATSPPPAVRDFIVQSEVATLRFLENTSVPAPRVYGYALGTDQTNQVGAGYILMEKMPGKSFDKSLASESQVKTVIKQLADIYLTLYQHPLPLMGALEQPGTDYVGGFAREPLIDFKGDRMVPVGPCRSISEYHIASMKLVLDLILRKEMYSEQAVDAYLIHRFLLDLFPQISSARSSDSASFFLKHADEKGDQILVDDDFNITAIIDWEWCSTTSLEHAFNSPIVLLDVAKFYDGETDIEEEEEYFARCFEAKGAHDLAKIVRQGRVLHFLSFCNGYDLGDWDGFLGLFRGLRDSAGVDAGIEWDEWKQRALQRYRDDEGLQTLLDDQRQ